jgi:hypothetical protein
MQFARHGASESNAVPRIWNPIGHHGLHRVALRTRIELVSFLRQRNCDSSRITQPREIIRGRTETCWATSSRAEPLHHDLSRSGESRTHLLS